MLGFLFGKKEEPKSIELNRVYSKLKERYNFSDIPAERKKILTETIEKYGYLNYPYIKALEELTPEEILFGLEIKWKQNKIFNGEFLFENKNISVLARNNVNNSDWIKKEGHNIKLINLAGLGDGNNSKEPGKFMNWLCQLLILPTGNMQNNIFNTTMYLIPFHPREFGCAYLPRSSDVSENLLDKEIQDLTGMDVKMQVQVFIILAQLAGHPVIYDVLPQTGRFSKAVLSNPHIARWYDIKKLEKTIYESVETVAQKLTQTLDPEDVEIVKDVYKQSLHGGEGDLSAHFQEIFNEFEQEMNEIKKELSNAMLKKVEQIALHKRVRDIVARIQIENANKQLTEDDITKQIDVIQELIQEGLWPAPGGAWCSAGVPVFDKMSQCGDYPEFKHYDYKGEDVTNFANLDCQTPYYFSYLEEGTYNKPVIEFFIESMEKIQKDYNFDGFRIDHIDHIVDKVSEKDGVPISYRAPRIVLKKLNDKLKSKIPYLSSLAEYMLWENLYDEYHNDMGFDMLWGNDIVSQFEKTPEKIIEDNQYLTNYNVNYKKGEKLSVLKTYNNQDGEFRCIDQYPGQLEPEGGIYKWFKYKFLPGGKFAQRPMLYIDGDESYTKTGIETVIGEEISMIRDKNYDFYVKFDAIDRFVKSQSIITEGEAQIITQEENGFVAWIISKEPLRTAFLVVSNYRYPSEKITKVDENGKSYSEFVKGEVVENAELHLPGDYTIVNEYVFNNSEYMPVAYEGSASLKIEELSPGEFKFFEIKKG